MKKYNNGNELGEKILSGVNKLANNVASTMGPGGRNVILHQKGSNPIITKDGVTVAKFVEENGGGSAAHSGGNGRSMVDPKRVVVTKASERPPLDFTKLPVGRWSVF